MGLKSREWVKDTREAWARAANEAPLCANLMP